MQEQRTEALEKKPDQLNAGDRFRDRSGRLLEVVKVERGRYSTFNVIVRVLSHERVGFDYTETIKVLPSGESHG